MRFITVHAVPAIKLCYWVLGNKSFCVLVLSQSY